MSALRIKAIKDVTRRKLRTALTVVGIAIGVMGLSAVGIVSSQLDATVKAANATSGLPDIAFGTMPASSATVVLLNRQPNVKLAESETDVSARWSIPSGHATLYLQGLPDFNDREIKKFAITAGQVPGPNEILMERNDLPLQSFRVGDRIELQVNGSPVFLRVSGISQTPGVVSASLGGGVAYMREADLQAISKLPGPNAFNVRLQDYGQRAKSAKQLAGALQASGVTVLGTTIGHDVSHGGSSILDGIFTIMQVLSGIALLLSIFLLLSTITTLLAEQVPIIGTMKAIGASRAQVIRNYLLGVAIYGLLGTLVGFGLGLLMGVFALGAIRSLAGIYTGNFFIPPALVVEVLVIGVAVPMLAALWPLFSGTRVTVQQAISGYGIERHAARRRVWLPLIGPLFGFLPQTVQLGARNLFRRRTRALLTLLALALSGAAFLAIQTTSASFNNVLDNSLATYHADIWAMLNNPVPADKVVPLVARVRGVDQIYPGTMTFPTTKWGSVEIFAPVSGGYRQQVLQGRWLTTADTNAVVVNESIAQKTGLGVGDWISFHSDVNSAQWHIVGIARDYGNPTALGVMLAPLTEINAFRHWPTNYVDHLLITSTSSRQSEIDNLSKRVDDLLSQNGMDAMVMTSAQESADSQSAFLVLYVLFYSVVAIVALVGAIGLFNSLAMGVVERRREIGILRSMGATGRKVAQVFLAEGIGLGVVGWLTAIVIGIPAAYGFVALLSEEVLRVPFDFNPMSLVVMFGFIVVVAALASVGPVSAASRVKIASTLRYE
jgi:putative ABC transport system permease protein